MTGFQGAEPESCAVQNFQIAMALRKGIPRRSFQDSDVAKWLEAARLSLSGRSGSELEAVADGMIEIIEKSAAGQMDIWILTSS